MIERTASQGRHEWSTPRRNRRRRSSKDVRHRHAARPCSRSSNLSASTSSRGPSSTTNCQVFQQFPQQPVNNVDYLDYLHPRIPNAQSTANQAVQTAATSLSPFFTSYSLVSVDASSPQSTDFYNVPSPNGAVSQISGDGLGIFWDMVTPTSTNLNFADLDNVSMLEGPIGSAGTFGSLDLSTPNTVASPNSDGYVFPPVNSELGSPRHNSHVMRDLMLPDGYFQNRHALNHPSFDTGNGSPIFSDDYPFQNDVASVAEDWSFGDTSTRENGQGSPATLIPQQPERFDGSILENYASAPSQIPWNPYNAQDSRFSMNANSGNGAFEPSRGAPYDMYLAGQDYLNANQETNTFFGPERPNQGWEEEWQLIPSDPRNYSPSHNSPQSRASSIQDSSPSPHNADEHSHLFSEFPGLSKLKPTRGRKGPLTTQEKREALEVREAKACWPCHLSKIKCSPCSPNSRCEKCRSLVGKRRFCLLSCFNDPIESLNTFLVPDYLMSHLSQTEVESWVKNYASGWGTRSIPIRMTWGHRIPVEASVVVVSVRSGESQLGYQNQATVRGTKRPKFVRKNSPPLGIPLAAMREMRDQYNRHVSDIVRSDLAHYVSIAYSDQDSMFPEFLLRAMCKFYKAGVEAGHECDILRQSIEIHITCTILERNLILDNPSIKEVQAYLGEEYPARTSPRCAQKQIKLALFLVQRQRIIKVLKQWGALMWTSKKHMSNEDKWAVSFSVLLMLTLVIDKTLGAAYFFCESKIAHEGAEAGEERRIFRQLVRLSETELFERCKEIFHTKFKTRKGGRESCNPVRDGLAAFRGKALGEGFVQLVEDLQAVVGDFEVRSHRSQADETARCEEESPYLDAGRLAGIFLDDFLHH